TVSPPALAQYPASGYQISGQNCFPDDYGTFDTFYPDVTDHIPDCSVVNNSKRIPQCTFKCDCFFLYPLHQLLFRFCERTECYIVELQFCLSATVCNLR